jgi:transcriptional regulator with XRE-family HTH domain
MNYENDNKNLGRMIKQRRVALALTLGELSARSGVSSSHLGRIERGERFPSARILKRIAKPLQLEENEIFALAGYLSRQLSTEAGMISGNNMQLDPIVAGMLAQEPIEVQRAVIAILTILKSITRSTP